MARQPAQLDQKKSGAALCHLNGAVCAWRHAVHQDEPRWLEIVYVRSFVHQRLMGLCRRTTKLRLDKLCVAESLLGEREN